MSCVILQGCLLLRAAAASSEQQFLCQLFISQPTAVVLQWVLL
jgi:hypothetical protein